MAKTPNKKSPANPRPYKPSVGRQIQAAKLVKGILAGKEMKIAAAEAGFSSTGRGYEAIRRPYVQSLLTDAIAQAGISLSDLALVVQDGLKAVKVMNTKRGPIVLQDQPDFDARYGAYDRITQAMGLIPHRTEMPGASAPGLTVNITQIPQKGAVTVTGDPTTDPSEPMTLNISVRPPE